jgi:hypothetical protein
MDNSRIRDYFEAFVSLFGSATICILAVVIYHILK